MNTFASGTAAGAGFVTTANVAGAGIRYEARFNTLTQADQLACAHARGGSRPSIVAANDNTPSTSSSGAR